MAKKVTTGVEKAYYAILQSEDTTATYDAVTYLPGLREITVSPKEERSSLYAENRLWDTESSLGEIEVSLDLTDIPPEHYTKLLGKKLAEGGGVIDSVDDSAPYIALMVEKTLSGGVKEYLTLYKGKLGIPEDKAKTKEGKTDYQTKSVSGVFMPLDTGLWKYSVRSDDAGFDKVTWDTKWGKQVVIPTEKTTA